MRVSLDLLKKTVSPFYTRKSSFSVVSLSLFWGKASPFLSRRMRKETKNQKTFNGMPPLKKVKEKKTISLSLE